MSTHIHLDPLGGVAGDMFAAALLDAFPELAQPAIAAIRAAGIDADVAVSCEPFDDGVLTGHRFIVTAPEPARGHDHHHHHHRHWSDLRRTLEASALEAPVKARTIAIFHELAIAEAAVHGRKVEDVAFHEVGHHDSIADIVAAAFLIETVGAASWSVGPLPLGSGRVRTAHGELPVPAPATLRLVEGFAVVDDGRPGERVTPTGAAILRHLAGALAPLPAGMAFGRAGYGFGTRRLAGMSNCLRAMCFERPAAADAPEQDVVGVIRFDVDDQTAEDLALAIGHLRAQPGVIEVVQAAVFGKKNRLATRIEVLTRPQALESVASACLVTTTTLGLRYGLERRMVVRREAAPDRGGLRVKLATRPGGIRTAKAESDDLQDIAGHAAREAARRKAEQAALRERNGEEGTDGDA